MHRDPFPLHCRTCGGFIGRKPPESCTYCWGDWKAHGRTAWTWTIAVVLLVIGAGYLGGHLLEFGARVWSCL